MMNLKVQKMKFIIDFKGDYCIAKQEKKVYVIEDKGHFVSKKVCTSFQLHFVAEESFDQKLYLNPIQSLTLLGPPK